MPQETIPSKIDDLIEKIIDDMGERPFAKDWKGEVRIMKKILNKHLKEFITNQQKGA